MGTLFPGMMAESRQFEDDISAEPAMPSAETRRASLEAGATAEQQVGVRGWSICASDIRPLRLRWHQGNLENLTLGKSRSDQIRGTNRLAGRILQSLLQGMQQPHNRRGLL